MSLPMIRNITIILSDKTVKTCKKVDSESFSCEVAELTIRSFGRDFEGLLSVSLKNLENIDIDNIIVSLDLGDVKNVLGLTLNPMTIDQELYGRAFRYYDLLAIDRSPDVSPPSDDMIYPYKLDEIDYEEFLRRTPCWSYPYISNDFAPYTIFALLRLEGSYLSLAAVPGVETISYLWRGFSLKILCGKVFKDLGENIVLLYGYSEDPYKAIEKMFDIGFEKRVFYSRSSKKKPDFMRYLGWCSWNALQTEDLSHKNIIKILRRIYERGLKIGFVIIDDGWQKEIVRNNMRILKDLSPDERKFPNDFEAVIKDLKSLGVRHVGLWHTINIHWGGVDEDFLRRFGGGFIKTLKGSYVPDPDYSEAYDLYRRLFKIFRDKGFDLLKIDNQWIVAEIYRDYCVSKASRNIQYAIQNASKILSIDILNCMSMTPENYTNYFNSNVMRSSIDYIPFWRLGAKLHLLYNVYNSLFFSKIVYPDYDMFISYDPYVIPHLITRLVSGGPIYVTDRDPEKTNIELLRRIVLSDGEIIRVDEPGLPTRDILFKDPYNNNVLLKIVAPIKWAWAVAIVNINRRGDMIREFFSIDLLPKDPGYDEYVFYKVFSGEKKFIRRNDRVEITLKELEGELLILSPVEEDIGVIGVVDYLLPPYPIEVVERFRRIRSLVRGRLLYYFKGSFYEKYVEPTKIIELSSL